MYILKIAARADMFILPYVALKKQTTDEYNTTPQSFWQMLTMYIYKIINTIFNRVVNNAGDAINKDRILVIFQTQQIINTYIKIFCKLYK